MEVLTKFTWHLTKHNMEELTKIKILNIHFALFCLMKSDGVNRMFPLAKRDISE